ncbi:MAG: hypothetical protein JRI68_34095 [Deltaproteobacteria bacterium]|nr:hypothetical protein [Deltaproteobacteria bacterium]
MRWNPQAVMLVALLAATAVFDGLACGGGSDEEPDGSGGTTTSSSGAGGGTTGGTGPGGAAGGGADGGSGGGTSSGTVRYIHRSDPADDVYLNDEAQWASWYDQHHYRMIVFSPFFDDKLSWYPNGWEYFDLYAIYAGSQLLAAHPEWVLRDGSDQMLFIPWGCSGGTCPQYAGDISSAAFRAWWIGEAQALIDDEGYRGLWIDDVNLDFRVGDGNGQHVAPIDPNTSAPMTEDDWRKYMAEFVTAIRQAIPSAEICHNSIWYAGGPERHENQWVQQQIAAADYLNIEHGLLDDGITGGSGAWSYGAVIAYVEAVHDASRQVVIEGFADGTTELEYSLAGYFLLSDGADGLGHDPDANPENWWPGHDVDLGEPLGPHDLWQGLRRREFDRGLVLVNEPDEPEKTVTLPEPYTTLDGTQVTEVTLAGKAGAVLRR